MPLIRMDRIRVLNGSGAGKEEGFFGLSMLICREAANKHFEIRAEMNPTERYPGLLGFTGYSFASDVPYMYPMTFCKQKGLQQ